MLRMANEKMISRYMRAGMNIILVGEHGIGKTSILKQVCNSLGYNMVFFGGATMDAYIDLVGIPEVVKNRDRTKHIEMVRKPGLSEADVVFIDEPNRGGVAVMNAMMEMVNDRSINGEPLPRLKCVVAAVNPTDSVLAGEYSVVGMDAAQMDRFDVSMSMGTEANADIISRVLRGVVDDDALVDKVAKAACEWQNALNFLDGDRQRAAYVSPRRVEKIARAFLLFGDRESINHVLGDDAGALNVNGLYRQLCAAANVDEVDVAAEPEDDFVGEILSNFDKVYRQSIVDDDTTALEDHITEELKLFSGTEVRDRMAEHYVNEPYERHNHIFDFISGLWQAEIAESEDDELAKLFAQDAADWMMPKYWRYWHEGDFRPEKWVDPLADLRKD